MEVGVDDCASASRRKDLRHLSVRADFVAGKEFGEPDLIEFERAQGTYLALSFFISSLCHGLR